MHEYPATRRIVEIAEERARDSGARRVRRIVLDVGDASGFVGDSVRMYFDACAAGTMCEGADLEIRRIRPKMRCRRCGSLFDRIPFTFDCPGCGGEGAPTGIGREFDVVAVDVE
jgi:hydrogenase nickel incorporation protein HypA/HybF